MTEMPPFLLFFIGAALVAVTRGHLRSLILVATPVVGLYLLWDKPAGSHAALQVMNFELLLFEVDRLSLLFGYLFHIAALICVVYSLHLRDTLQQTCSLLYAGSALGAVFSGDFLTLFIFWELLAITSVFLIWARRTEKAYGAGLRYFTIHIVSGLLLLAGVIIHGYNSGSLAVAEIGLQGTSGWLIFIAFGIKCAFPFMHNWLTDAYPESTPTGTVLLASFTTKVAVYALARCYPGTELLVYIGATMACFPIFFAVIENDLRRVLAYSLINQLGFMVVGIGIGTALSINGAVAHAFNDVIFKGLLLMSMGAVLHVTGKINGSELGGLYKTMPKTTILCIVGAASISAFPLFSGFVSKSMVMSAALKNDFHGVWLILLFASAGVFHHAGIKIPYFAFFAHDSGIRAKEPPLNMLIAMTIAATLCIGVGSYPQVLYSLLPFDVEYTPYDVTHVLTQLQLLFFSALAFVWLNLKGMYPPELPSTNLDAEWLYRKPLPRFLNATFDWVLQWQSLVRGHAIDAVSRLVTGLSSHHRAEGVFARTWQTGWIVFWVLVVMAFYLEVGLF